MILEKDTTAFKDCRPLKDCFKGLYICTPKYCEASLRNQF